MKAIAIRLMVVLTIAAMLVSVSSGPPSQAKAAGSSLWVVSIKNFCRGHVFGDLSSASLKFAIILENTGTRDIEGTPFVVAGAQSPAVNPYFTLSVTHGPVLLYPGESVSFVATAKGINLARTTGFRVGIDGDESSAYTYTPFYANANAIPAC